MSKMVKLIWDFRGPNAAGIADHHVSHLNSFLITEGIESGKAALEGVTEMHYIAYIIVDASMTQFLRDRLKPNRGQYYSN